MDKIKIQNMYSPTGVRESNNRPEFELLMSNSMGTTTLYPSVYSGQLSPYPSVNALRYLDSTRVVYIGSQGTTRARNCSRNAVIAMSFADIGIDSYEVSYSNLSFAFINPSNNYIYVCHVVMEPNANDSNFNDAYWVDSYGQRVSDIFTATSFKFAVFHGGLTYYPRQNSWCIYLVLYMETIEQGSGGMQRVIRRFDGAGDNRFLPYPYDPDNTYEGIQANGLVMGGGQMEGVYDYTKVKHDIVLTTDQELT